MKEPRRRLEVNLEELDRVLDGARQAPLSDQDHHKLREALHVMAAMLVRSRNTEKTSSVVGKAEDASGHAGKQPDPNEHSFDYLIELQRHARELAARPEEWMPWNYRDTLARTVAV